MKVLKGLVFFLLAILVFCGFITPFSIIPKNFEAEARQRTLDRLEQTGTVVDESYVNASVDEAVHANLFTIYRTAIIVSLAAAFIVCLITLRPPHDCGGINLFNPLALPLIAIAAVSTAAIVTLALDGVQGQGVIEFKQLTSRLYTWCSGGTDRLLIALVIPVMLEVIFRGYIFSLFEKLHFSVAIVLSTVMYGFAAYYCYSSFGMRSIGSDAGAETAMFIALFVGAVNAVMTWRLRSGIPAVLSHLIIANSAPLMSRMRGSSLVSMPSMIILLVLALAMLVFLPVLFAKKIPLFAYDFPFTEWHKRREKLLGSKKKLKEEASESADETAGAALPNLMDDSAKGTADIPAAEDTQVVASYDEGEAVPVVKAEDKKDNKSKKDKRQKNRRSREDKDRAVKAAAEDAEVIEEVSFKAEEAVIAEASAVNDAFREMPAEAAEEVVEAVEEKTAAIEATVTKAADEVREAVEEKTADIEETVTEAAEAVEEAVPEAVKTEPEKKKERVKRDNIFTRFFARRKSRRERAAKRAARKEVGPGPETLEFSKRAVARELKLKAAADRAEKSLAEMADKASKAIADSTEGKGE